MTINEIFEKFIHPQTLPLGANSVSENTPPNEPMTVKAFWRDKKLVVEITVAQVGKVIGTFETANINQLAVTTRIEDKRFAKPLTVRRVYDRSLTKTSRHPEQMLISPIFFYKRAKFINFLFFAD